MSVSSFFNTDLPRIRVALEDAARQEPGNILNDHYSSSFYVQRRTHFLGAHPDYAHRLSGLFATARDDAYLVYGPKNHDLSVQEVRRRELTHEIIPLLPLPTTGNTQTISEWDEYPDQEWREGIEVPRVWRSPSPSPPPARNSNESALSYTDARRLELVSRSTPVSPYDITQSTMMNSEATPPTSPFGYAQYAPLSSTKQPSTAVSETVTKARQTAAEANSFLLRRSNSVPDDYQKFTTMSDPGYGEPPPQQHPLIPAIIARLGQPQDANGTSSSAVAPPTGASTSSTNGLTTQVSALKYRGTNQPVKRKRGTGDPVKAGENVEEISTDGEGGTEEENRDDAVKPPPKKKLKIIVGSPSKPKAASKAKATPKTKTAPTSAPSDTAVPKKRSTGSIPKSRGSIATKTPRVQPAPTQTSAPGGLAPNIQAIVSGAQLPTTPDEAQEADEARHALLLRRHSVERRRRKRRIDPHPEFMPEYFETAQFPEDSKDDQVRCMCGALEDNKAFVMVSCDECMVWQHNHCAGPAGLANPEKEDYLCHNCDPWAHRVVIQRMRQKNVVTE